ncbi:hypothetical protein KBY91_00475 [Streptomyces sp. RK23]|uniref:hypothetical protein n=1 Tax=Streptomyces TaxID=1883 RepID=UPI001B380266|nr:MULTISPECIES: hypothetical protein [unclassified Streptomyces]MBQ0962112.1 hypothetical protein [Streptomyces sp. RK74B]MBQ1001894.1 hypothetical protein [Streptomyces sp. RK23]
MATHLVYGDSESRLSRWQRVRRYAVPPAMIETATARRRAGDWAGACAAAAFDVDLDLRRLARTRGHALASRIRADLRHLAPDLLRWHMPRIAPDGLLRPGLTLTLARYDTEGRDGVRPVHLVVRTPPAWADGGQRISLALWDGSGQDRGTARHPHPRPSRRFRLDLHRHLWDARRTGELRVRSGADLPPPGAAPPGLGSAGVTVPYGRRCALDRWDAEARILLRAEDGGTGAVVVRVAAGQRLVLEPAADGTRPSAPRILAAPTGGALSALPVLPDAATWVLPDLELVRAGAIEADRLHPLVTPALLPDHVPAAVLRTPDAATGPRIVDCRGARHRIGFVDGALAALDHDPAEVRREELLAALTGTPLPCFQVIDAAHRRPESLPDIRERLNHGDTAGALAAVESLLGPAARLRDGALRDDLEAAALRRVAHGMFRAGLDEPAPGRLRPDRHRPRTGRSRPRHATFD